MPLFSRDFLSLFCSEDSGHYVWYSLLYLTYYPSACIHTWNGDWAFRNEDWAFQNGNRML